MIQLLAHKTTINNESNYRYLYKVWQHKVKEQLCVDTQESHTNLHPRAHANTLSLYCTILMTQNKLDTVVAGYNDFFNQCAIEKGICSFFTTLVTAIFIQLGSCLDEKHFHLEYLSVSKFLTL